MTNKEWTDKENDCLPKTYFYGKDLNSDHQTIKRRSVQSVEKDTDDQCLKQRDVARFKCISL